ncbi:tRNA lysidine(34) synthetase TilS [Ktedonosporobacter rubrisoli]|uniref:tRNA(Ile)-lysidine synthase n=1 Tax=Ktedonosporobacter rubrisoli TaxID=2509675 RepID=A0A4P6JXS5_KTERU|nr:tRNA lysidine(34) synthetase TilS [Ktedonosporobacter rubrisoli]QBD80233.1 tRNA lysidine(34) synthetase TilS [Ktedonosporobacter rubrisoli]
MVEIIEVVIAYSEQHGLLPDHSKIVVAVSGGADSLCLLHLLHSLCGPGKRFPTVRLHVAHLNHQLRGEEGARDAAAVANLAAAWDLPATIGAIDVPALAQQERRSLEEAAREARYRFLRQVAQELTESGGETLIAVAHHMDDQVETLLLHWLRGGGLASMIGLQPRQRDIIRPLLCLSRADTQAYCREHGLTPMEDSSNTDPRFLRNRLRHELLPLLESLNPGIRATLLRNAEVMQADLALIEEQVEHSWPRVVSFEQSACIGLRCSELQALPLSLQRHLLRRVTARLSAGQSPLELRHYRLIEQLAQRKESAEEMMLHLPQHLRVRRKGDTLLFTRDDDYQKQPSAKEEPIEVTLPIPGQHKVPGTSLIACAEIVAEAVTRQVVDALAYGNWNEVWHILAPTRYVVYIDGGSVGHTLHVRTRRPGDRIRLLGMAREKKVQDVLVDKHIARAEREQIPLFFSAKHCIWLAGVQVDDRVRLTEQTRHIVRLSIRPMEPDY